MVINGSMRAIHLMMKMLAGAKAEMAALFSDDDPNNKF